MGFFSGLVEIVTLPVAVAKDVATLGLRGAMEGETFTEEKLEEIKDEFER